MISLISKACSVLILSARFLKAGKAHNLNFLQRLYLLFRIFRNAIVIPTASSPLEHLWMATVLLNIPPELEGDIIECGTYKGGSTANLSLIARVCNRKLIACDSFEGLPEPTETDRVHTFEHIGRIKTYEKGQYAGSLEEVMRNVQKYGAPEVTKFVKGYFEDTLPTLDGRFSFIFLDVDLRSSLETCLRYLWPRLEPGGYLFTHEAQDIAFISLFFDKEWWQENLGSEPPGILGAGSGLPIYICQGSGLAYIKKR